MKLQLSNKGSTDGILYIGHHQEEYVHRLRYQCCLQSIVKLKDKRKLKLKISCGEMCVSGRFHLTAITQLLLQLLGRYSSFYVTAELLLDTSQSLVTGKLKAVAVSNVSCRSIL